MKSLEKITFYILTETYDIGLVELVVQQQDNTWQPMQVDIDLEVDKPDNLVADMWSRLGVDMVRHLQVDTPDHPTGVGMVFHPGADILGHPLEVDTGH